MSEDKKSKKDESENFIEAWNDKFKATVRKYFDI
jgi:hypothetical protein